MKRVICTIGLICFFAIFGYHDVAADNGIPSISIALNGTAIDIIHAGTKDIKYPDNFLTVTDFDHIDSYAGVEIKGRGNSTWAADKRPYQIKFAHTTDLLGLGASKKWVLLADYLDDSHLRNHLAFYLSYLLDMPYRDHGQHVDLYIDGEYRGLYYLCHKNEISQRSVRLQDPQGVLVEMDNLWEPDDDFFVSDYDKNRLLFKDVKTDDPELAVTAFVDFRQAFNRFERALYASDWNGVKQEIDLESFAQYFLMAELSVDVDGFASSVFFYKDGPHDLIHAGPIWDYDLAFANFRWSIDGPTLSPHRSWAQRGTRQGDFAIQDSTLWQHLMDFPEFRAQVRQIYQNKIFGHAAEIDEYLLTNADYLQDSASRDNATWWRENFRLSVDLLRDWVQTRLAYLDQLYAQPDQVTSGTYRINGYDDIVNRKFFTGEFFLQAQDDGSYKILDTATSYALSVVELNQFNETGNQVYFQRSRLDDSQRWYLIQKNDQQFYLVAKRNGLFLGCNQGQLELQEYRGDDAQSFNLFYKMQKLIHANRPIYYRLQNNFGPSVQLSNRGGQLMLRSPRSLDAGIFLVERQANGSYVFIDRNAQRSRPWIIQENPNGSLKLIDSQGLRALSRQRQHVVFTELAETPDQDWLLQELRLPQFADPRIIVYPAQ